MSKVASRDLRNHTADVLARVQAGEVVQVTVHGEVVAEVHPPRRARPDFFTATELVERLPRAQADPGLRADLAELAGDTTEDLGTP
jgi:antitoxin (DNA-binding transcriptional repressor) of toxin-antitoxin stability system